MTTNVTPQKPPTNAYDYCTPAVLAAYTVAVPVLELAADVDKAHNVWIIDESDNAAREVAVTHVPDRGPVVILMNSGPLEDYTSSLHVDRSKSVRRLTEEAAAAMRAGDARRRNCRDMRDMLMWLEEHPEIPATFVGMHKFEGGPGAADRVRAIAAAAGGEAGPTRYDPDRIAYVREFGSLRYEASAQNDAVDTAGDAA